MTRRTLKRRGYTIKHSIVGWWVDGFCGYKVGDGYANSEAQAVLDAGNAIAAAKVADRKPIWLFA